MLNGSVVIGAFTAQDQIKTYKINFATSFTDDNVMVSIFCGDGYLGLGVSGITKDGFTLKARNEWTGNLGARTVTWQAIGYKS